MVVALLLVLLAVVADLTRHDSLLRDSWHRMTGPRGTPAERLIKEVTP